MSALAGLPPFGAVAVSAAVDSDPSGDPNRPPLGSLVAVVSQSRPMSSRTLRQASYVTRSARCRWVVGCLLTRR